MGEEKRGEGGKMRKKKGGGTEKGGEEEGERMCVFSRNN